MQSPERGATHDTIDATRGRTFLEAAFRAWEDASQRTPSTVEHVRLAGQDATLHFAGHAMREAIWPSLEHAAVTSEARGFHVHLFDSTESGVAMPPPPWEHEDLLARGEVKGYREGALRFTYNLGSGVLLAYDADAHRALVWTRDARAIPYYETACPLRPLWAWWLGDRGLQIVHAAAVGRNGRGLLLTGKGFSGKSTTALLCVEAGWSYAGDNNLVLDPGPPLRGSALYASATVRPGTLERMPKLAEHLANEERLDLEKGLLFVGRTWGRMLPDFEVAAILLPHVTGEPTSRLEPATAAACMAALAPSSLLPLPGAAHATFTRLAAISRGAPVYTLALGEDVGSIPALLAPLVEV
ncbi:MAG: hypothetical protein H6805_01545 [Planctomycetes bacterium]|nr:hypothetical protein [Planctomycetota bacterium]